MRSAVILMVAVLGRSPVAELVEPEEGEAVNQAGEAEMLHFRAPPPVLRMVKKFSALLTPKSMERVDKVRMGGGGGWTRVTDIKAVPPSMVTVIVAEYRP